MSTNRNVCTKCGSDNEGAQLWDMADIERLCQMCWEQHCGEAFWKAVGSVEDVAVAIGMEAE